MHPARSYRSLIGSRLVTACALLTLGLTSACGATAAQPTPTAPPPTAAAAAPVASPQRPPLNTPSPAPSLAVPTPAVASSTEPEQTYTVQSGDTLLSIAEQFYGDGTKWRRIYDANKDVIGSDPDKLKLETKLKIPPKDTSGG
jgi:5'-nucleotidase/UDP-sugar diphosphatase